MSALDGIVAPVSPPLYLTDTAAVVVRIIDSPNTDRPSQEAARIVWRALIGVSDPGAADTLARLIATQDRGLVAHVPPL